MVSLGKWQVLQVFFKGHVQVSCSAHARAPRALQVFFKGHVAFVLLSFLHVTLKKNLQREPT